MNNGKQITILRQQNRELLKQIEDLEFKLEQDKNLNQNSITLAKKLIENFTLLQQNWQEAINGLKEKENEYQELIDDLKVFRSELYDIKKIMKRD